MCHNYIDCRLEGTELNELGIYTGANMSVFVGEIDVR